MGCAGACCLLWMERWRCGEGYSIFVRLCAREEGPIATFLPITPRQAMDGIAVIL